MKVIVTQSAFGDFALFIYEKRPCFALFVYGEVSFNEHDTQGE